MGTASVLGLNPERFWRTTPHELFALLAARDPDDRSGAEEAFRLFEDRLAASRERRHR